MSRAKIFRNYWKKENTWDFKRQFIPSRIKTSFIKRERPTDGSKGAQKKQTYNFDINENKV